ncbi:hypothetical protein DXG01_003477 [Tephrocybe rancida]|nr:hypothetical protein DXG01_003477 [Tephrocybe rancida]
MSVHDICYRYGDSLWHREALNIPDILFRILGLVKSSEPNGDVDFISCTHVSHIWRSIALGFPLLWINPLLPPKWNWDATRVSLARSKDGPFELYIPPVDSCSFRDLFYNGIQGDLHRCRKLVVDSFMNDADILGLFKHLENVHLPGLESLDFRIHRDRTMDWGFWHQHLFKAGAPLLRKVRLGDVCVTMCTPPLANITTLHLSQEDAHYVPPFNLAAFQRMLRQCPVLEVLILSGKFRLHRTVELEVHEPVSMPRLQSVQLFAFHATMTIEAVLGVMDVPALQDVVYVRCEAHRPPLERSQDKWRHPSSEMCPNMISVKTLALSDARPCPSSALRSMRRFFPNIEHLIVPKLKETFIPDCAWPGLRTLSTRNLDQDTVSHLCAFVIAMKENGGALETLYLDEDSLKCSLAGLEGVVDVVCADGWKKRVWDAGLDRWL